MLALIGLAALPDLVQRLPIIAWNQPWLLALNDLGLAGAGLMMLLLRATRRAGH